VARDDGTGQMLWLVANRWQAAQRAALKPYDLTHVQFLLLRTLTRLGRTRAVSQRELSRHAATDPMMTSQVVRTLENKGLVTREPHPTDGRAWAVRATRAGSTLCRRAAAAASECDAQFFGPLGRTRQGFRTALTALDVVDEE
jgi:DNA-binding MarR family transcriptional regulator